jgi:ACT domain-containing protein
LIYERLRGEDSFWKPFLDYLPSENETLATIANDVKIHPQSEVTLISEIQRQNDDIHNKIEYIKKIN